jgi:hypothetical protein
VDKSKFDGLDIVVKKYAVCAGCQSCMFIKDKNSPHLIGVEDITEEYLDLINPAIPKCGKCGLVVTTGLMAAFCEHKKECEFYVEGADEFLDGFTSLSSPQPTVPSPTNESP